MRLLKGMILACCLSAPLLAQNESLLIGPGDEVNVEVFDTPDLDQNARVTDSGDLPLMLGGTVRLPRSRRQRLLARSKRLLSGRM